MKYVNSPNFSNLNSVYSQRYYKNILSGLRTSEMKMHFCIVIPNLNQIMYMQMCDFWVESIASKTQVMTT